MVSGSFAQTAKQPLPLMQALEASPGWQAANLNYLSVQQQLDSQRAANGLSIVVGGTGSGSVPITPPGTISTSASITASASAQVLPGFSRNLALMTGERNLNAARYSLRDARNNLYINTLSQIIDQNNAKLDFDIAQKSLSQAKRQLEVAQTQRKLATITLEQLLAVQQSFDQATLDFSTKQNVLLTSTLVLSNTLGISAEQALGLAANITQVFIPSETLEQLTQTAMASRTEIIQSNFAVANARDTLGNYDQQRWIPATTLSANYRENYSSGSAGGSGGQGLSISSSLDLNSGMGKISTSAPLFGENFGQFSSGLTFSATISLPITAPQNESQTYTAQTSLSLAENALQTAINVVQLDVRQKFLNLQNTLGSQAIATTGVTIASSALETQTIRLKNGTATQLDVDAANLNLVKAERNLSAAKAQSFLAELQLRVALGQNLFGGEQ